MQKTYKSMYGQMAYVLISGLQLLFMPDFLLTTFKMMPASDVWIQVMGLLVTILAFYYYAMAKHGTPPVVRATVYGRLVFCAGLVVFVLYALVEPPVLLFAAAETALAVWTWVELRR
jgi:hypothetical protein